MWKDHNNTLVDGHNRYEHCKAKRQPFPMIEKDFVDRDAVKSFIIHTHQGRRNLSPLGESYVRGKRYLEAKHQGVRNDLTSAQNEQKSAAELVGEELKVGPATVRRDGAVAQAVDGIVVNCDEDARDLLVSRDSGLTRGGVLRLAKLGPAEQKNFLEALKANGKRPRKARQAKREKTIRLPLRPKALAQTLLKKLSPTEIGELAELLTDGVAKQQHESLGGKRNGRARKGSPRSR